MSDLSPEAQKWLEEARGAHSPEARDRDRVLASLSASLGLVVPTVMASTADAAREMATSGVTERVAQTAAENVVPVANTAVKPGLSLGAKLLGWKAGKVVLAAVALGSVISVGSMQRASRPSGEGDARVRTGDASSRPAEKPRADGVSPRSVPRPQVEVAAKAPAIAETKPVAMATGAVDAPAMAVVEAPAHVAREAERVAAAAPSTLDGVRHERASRRGSYRTSTYRTRVHREVMAAVAPVQPEPQVEEPPVAAPAPQELELIRKAMTSLRDHAPERALALLEEHEGRYPNGAFATERRGLHAVALCAAGRTAEGRSEQAAFLRSDGASPIAQRVRRACEP